jgi:hypothetical protein
MCGPRSTKEASGKSWRWRPANAMPAIYAIRENEAAGGLMSYGTSFADANRQAGIYVEKILKAPSPPTSRWCSH